MAATPTELLSNICNICSRIEKSLGDGKGKGAGAKAAGASSSALFGDSTNALKGLKGMGKEIKEIALGLKVFSLFGKSGDKFISFITSVCEPIVNFGGKEITQGVKNFSLFASALHLISIGDVITIGALSLVQKPFIKLLNGLGIALSKLGDKDVENGTKALSKVGKAFKDLGGGIAILMLTIVVGGLALSSIGIAGGIFGVLAGLGVGLLALWGLKKIGAVNALNSIGHGFLFLAGGIAMLTLSVALSSILLSNVSGGAIVGGILGVFTSLIAIMGLLAVAKASGAMIGIEALGDSIMKLGAGMALFSLTFVLSSLILTSVVKSSTGDGILAPILGAVAAGGGPLALLWGTIKIASSVNVNFTPEQAIAFNTLSKSILLLGAGLAVFSITFIVSALAFKAIIKNAGLPAPWDTILGAVVGGAGPLALMWGTIKIASKAGKDIDVKSVGGMTALATGIAALGGALFVLTGAFTASLAIGGTIFDDIKLGPITIPGGIFAVTGSLGLLFVAALVGKLYGNWEKDIAKGGIAMAAVGIGLTAFGIGLGACMLAIGDNPNWEAFGFLAASIGAFGIEFGIVGTAIGAILPGAGAVAAMGGGLAAFGLGFGACMLGVGDDVDWDGIKNLAKLIGLLGIEFSGLGIASVLIGLGSVAATAIGVGLLPIGLGVKAFQGAIGDGFNSENFKTVLSDVIDGYVEALPGPIDTLKIMSSVGVVKQIGKALSILGQGVGAWASLASIRAIKGYDKDDNPIYDNEKIPLTDAINNIKEFLSVDENNKSIFSPFLNLAKELPSEGISFFLNPAGGSKLTRAIGFALNIGKVLSGLARGIAAWMNLQNMHPINGYDKDGNPTYDFKNTLSITDAIGNLKTVLSTDPTVGVLTPFIEFAKQAGGDDFEKNFLGAIVAREIGNAMSSLGEGIATFANLQNMKLIKSYDKNGKPIYSDENVNVETAISNLKTLLGSAENEKSIFSAFKTAADELYGGMFNNTGENISNIAKLAGDIGGGLSNIVNGLTSFASIDKLKVIKSYDANGNPIYDTSNTVNGNTVISTIQSVVSGVINAIKTDANGNENQISDETVDTFKSLTKILTEIQEPLIKIGESSENIIKSKDVLVDVVNAFGDPTRTTIVSNASSELGKFATSWDALVKTHKDTEKFGSAITKIIDKVKSIPDTTLTIVKDLTDALNKFTESDHAENLLKSVVALQTLLETPASEQTGNKEADNAKAEVSKQMTPAPNDKKESSSNSGKAEANSNSSILSAIEKLDATMAQILSTLQGEINVKTQTEF